MGSTKGEMGNVSWGGARGEGGGGAGLVCFFLSHHHHHRHLLHLLFVFLSLSTLHHVKFVFTGTVHEQVLFSLVVTTACDFFEQFHQDIVMFVGRGTEQILFIF